MRAVVFFLCVFALVAVLVEVSRLWERGKPQGGERERKLFSQYRLEMKALQGDPRPHEEKVPLSSKLIRDR